jgi:hypothetical protein
MAASSDRDLYRRNPARDIERFAVRVVRVWLGDMGVVQDTSAGHEPDFRLSYRDGRNGWGEVGWHEDPELRAMWSLTFRKERHQQIDLPPGSGLWAVSLVKGASIRALYNELPGLIADLVRQGQTQLEIVGNWPRTDLADTARRLGIEYIDRSGDSSDTAFFFMPGSGGTVPTDPNVIADWVSAVLADSAYADTTRKLLDREADERHIFLMSGSRTDFGVDERLRRLGEGVPSRSPFVADGISHIWVVSQFGAAPAGLWIRDRGWFLIPLPPDEADASTRERA